MLHTPWLFKGLLRRDTFDGGVPVNPCDHFVLAELEVRERLVLLTEGGQQQYNPNSLMVLTPKHWFP